jgi:DNA-binding beta-propeller fold protein YncE
MTRLWLGLLGLAAVATPLFAEDKPTFPVQVNEIPLGEGAPLSSMALDAVGGRLYVSRGGIVEVLDVAKAESVAVVEGIERARGIAVVPELKRGYVVSAKKNRLIAFDLETRKVVKEVATGDDPDAVLYVSWSKELWVFNQGTSDVTCVDPAALEVKATIKLPSSPRTAVEVPAAGHVYVCLATPEAVGVIDARSKKLVGTHTIVPAGEPVEIAFDPKFGHVFVATDSQQFVVLENKGWKTVAKAELNGACGGICFDPATANAFVVCEDKTPVFHVNEAKSVSLLQKSVDAPGGRACAVDSKSKKLFIACGPKKSDEGTSRVWIYVQR